MKTKPLPASCPYGTYQRATSGLPLSCITTKVLIRGLYSRLKPAVRHAHAYRAARHSLIRGALAHLAEDRATVRHFRF